MVECPQCHTQVSDGALYCPQCHTALGLTQKIQVTSLTWCASCGALLQKDEHVCPKCGAEQPKKQSGARTTRQLDLPLIESVGPMLVPEVTLSSHRTTPQEPQVRIESAIPAADNSPSMFRTDRLPRTKVFVVASLAALLVVGGAALIITHPWDPYGSQASSSEKIALDPGSLQSIQTLKGQDDIPTPSSDDTQEETEGTQQSSTDDDSSKSHTGDDTFDALMDAYTELGTLAPQVDDAEDDFYDTAFSADIDTRKAAYAKVRTLAVSVSNTISTIQSIDTRDTSYEQSQANILKLGNWLRNRVDELSASWKLSVAAQDPQEERASIVAPMETYKNADGVNTYKALFEKNYSSFKPVQATN